MISLGHKQGAVDSLVSLVDKIRTNASLVIIAKETKNA